MAADVSSLIGVVSGGGSSEAPLTGKSAAPITRDFLGGSCTLDSKELDLDLQVPCGWEKRLDLKSGKMYIQRCSSSNSSSSTSENKPRSSNGHLTVKFQDLNFPPVSKKPLDLFDDSALELKLVPPPEYRSMCTLDKVEAALERAKKEVPRKRSMSISKSSSTRSNSSSSPKDSDPHQEAKTSGCFAAGCPCCLLYVLISKNDPKCPQCNSNVPLPPTAKRPRLDLNISIKTGDNYDGSSFSQDRHRICT